MRIGLAEISSDLTLSLESSIELAAILMRCVQTEYPNYPAHLMLGPQDVCSPKSLHPAFYGCYDWHSAVHSHWSLVHLANIDLLPSLSATMSVLQEHLSLENIQVELDYMNAPERRGYERPYGWAWLLTLAGELATARTEELRLLGRNVAPIEQLIVRRFLHYLPRMHQPNRTGLHGNTAFSLGLVWDYSIRVGNQAVQEVVDEAARRLYPLEERASFESEPGPTDFLSPSLVHADLMRRVLIQEEFGPWFDRFVGSFSLERLAPAVPADRSDGALCHLDGLNLSRAWCMRNIAECLGSANPHHDSLISAALAHADAGLPHVASGHFVGEHWLPTFAVYLLRRSASVSFSRTGS